MLRKILTRDANKCILGISKILKGYFLKIESKIEVFDIHPANILNCNAEEWGFHVRKRTLNRILLALVNQY